MTFRVEITKSATSQYHSLNEPFKSAIKKKIDALGQTGLKTPQIKTLTGEFKGAFRLRAGNYRIIFTMENSLITIISILHRKEAYK